jgi:hypothetical protein
LSGFHRSSNWLYFNGFHTNDHYHPLCISQACSSYIVLGDICFLSKILLVKTVFWHHITYGCIKTSQDNNTSIKICIIHPNKILNSVYMCFYDIQMSIQLYLSKTYDHHYYRIRFRFPTFKKEADSLWSLLIKGHEVTFNRSLLDRSEMTTGGIIDGTVYS